MDYSGIILGKQYQTNNAHKLITEMQRMDNSDHRVSMCPDRFLSSIFEDPGRRAERLEKSTNIHMPSRLPVWLCNVIAVALGTGRDHRDEYHNRNARTLISTLLHIFTLVSGLCFGVCGLYFNVYDTMSTFTKTTVLVSVSKCVIGLYWILMGIYSHSLAARLISNPRVVDCIRLHSKTFIKVNMAFIIAILMTSVICLNLYTNVYLLDPVPHASNKTLVYDANCGSIGVNIVLCKVYYTSKVVFSFLSLCWNLMVAAICLSICRTLTIGIRRFIRELNFDSHIYEEYQMTHYYRQLSTGVVSPEAFMKDIDESWTIWDDDVKAFDDESVFQLSSTRESTLKELKTMRRRMSGQGNLVDLSTGSRQEQVLDYNVRKVMECQERSRERQRLMSERSMQSISSPESIQAEATRGKDDHDDADRKSEKSQNEIGGHGDVGGPSGPPVISNQDLMFTYFKLMRRMSSTSRLLQRWMSSWITFVLLWCITLIIFWVRHTATLTDLMEFLLPVVTIGFMTSAYAEVNFEGGRVLKSLLPLEERLPVIYYIQNAGLELKIFSFVMTYNVLVTVLAGVALTIASRIIIEQIT